MEGTYKGITLMKFNGDLKIADHSHRELKPDEVLVKIMSTSILPADLALLNGMYGSALPKLPNVLGMEGSGLVEKVGSNVDNSIVGKRCGLFAISSSSEYHGTWAEYCYVPYHNILVFDKEVDFDKITGCQGNPLTAVGFLDTIIKAGKKSVAHTGASSSFGRMFMRLCINQGIEVVNIVRKESSIKELSEFGGKHFVNTSVKGWEKDLKKYCDDLDISIIFDCAGGDITGNCISALKDYGTLYHFGNLELKRLEDLDPNDFIFGHKKMEGWWLNKWMTNASQETLTYWRNIIKDDFENNDGKVFLTEYKGSFKLTEIEQAFITYQTSSGKVLFKPWN